MSVITAFSLMMLNNENWPDGDDGEMLDTENFGFTSVSEDKIVFSAGGDWQKPSTMELTLDGEENYLITVLDDNKFSDSLDTLEVEKFFIDASN